MTKQEFLDAFKAIPTKLASMATWKKVLIIGSICIVILGVNDLGFYCLGTKTCKPTAPTEIKPSEKPKEKTTIIIKDPKYNDPIDLSAKMINNKKIEVTAKTHYVQTIKNFDLIFSCPTLKNQIGFGLGLLFTYDNLNKKFTPLVGANISYTHWWGNFGFGPQVRAYGAIDKSMYSAGIDAVINYRW
jgi:hypothetical protein